MAVKLRLRRLGRTHHAYYQIVAADARSPRDGRFIEKLGQYDPNQEFDKVQVDHEVAIKWLKSGAQPTETVKSILSSEGLMLKLHLHRKGKSEEEVEKAYEEWKAQKEAKVLGKKEEVKSKKQKEQEERLAAETAIKEARVKKAEEAAAAKKAEEEAAAEAEAEAAPAEAEATEEAPAAEEAAASEESGEEAKAE
mgnify:CR=1 FL=1